MSVVAINGHLENLLNYQLFVLNASLLIGIKRENKMGGGKRNYRSMRARHRQWKKEEKPIEVEKKTNKEDQEEFIKKWGKLQKK